jgi:hypothetical protein
LWRNPELQVLTPCRERPKVERDDIIALSLLTAVSGSIQEKLQFIIEVVVLHQGFLILSAFVSIAYFAKHN